MFQGGVPTAIGSSPSSPILHIDASAEGSSVESSSLVHTPHHTESAAPAGQDLATQQELYVTK